MSLNLNLSRLAELWDLARSNEAPTEVLSSEELLIFKQYQAINGSLAMAWHNAPSKALDRAKSIMPRSVRKFSIANLIHPKPVLGFARGAVSQVQYESEDVHVRIQFEKIPNGWRLWGRTSESGWEVWSGESNVKCNEDGEFEITVHTKSFEPLSLQSESTTILLPQFIDEIGDASAKPS